ncbi:hypothetical protein SODALDRAFT_328536 [Sodiomyces alkalinus F11]|uniref:DUF7053 domain-containing protein n=1 Tax=Sodiomyces alkalinus (strain CBS 110278 / VKM F-3762 / F11) TaxID=1314773 RepID=A0A3N2PNS0_SODAK|nr:hypothetical protein SODALDRAFT_328536 [Sodiomyces alkalinus F11]ROT36168.1 hypothetical protein SODALDRAFT_328536 [Sodiomyces alkalinus F11]
MLRRKEVYTTITPIPGFIPRQLAIDILHSHSEVITLNPLVLDHKPIPAPRDAAADEYYSTWYEITERMQWIPGLGKMGSGKIKFTGCFHDMPWGLQTHTYVPMGIDIRIKYRIDGNQPGLEPPQPPELGLAELGAPADGLYLREDIEIRCNVTMVGFVKSELKAASKEMVSRIIKKAELLDAGVLSAMFEDGKLRTINPNDRSQSVRLKSPPPSTTSPSAYSTHAVLAGTDRPGTAGSSAPSYYPQHPHHYHPQQKPQQPQQQQQQYPQYPLTQIAELPPAHVPLHHPVEQTTFIAELPGNYYHPQTSPRLPQQQQQQQQADTPLPSPNLHNYNPNRDSRDSRDSRASVLSNTNSGMWRSPQPSPQFPPPAGQPSPLFASSRPTSLASSAPRQSWPVDTEQAGKG